LEGKQKKKNGIYLDPHIENKQRYFFRIKYKYIDDFWKMTDTEMLLLISIWQYNKEWEGSGKKYLINNEEWRNLKIAGKSFEIASENNYRAMQKFEKMGIVKIEGDKKNRKFFYDFKKQEGTKEIEGERIGFANIPLHKIKNYLETFGKTNVRTYIFILYKLYNSRNHRLSKSNNAKYGIRKLFMSQKRIGQIIGKSKKTIYRHMKDLVENGFLKVEKISGRNQYYVPYYKDDNYYYETLSKKKVGKTSVKTEKEELWENSEGIIKPLPFWKKKYGKKLEKVQDMGLLKRKVG
jgi:biotin operon repressor